MTKALFAAGLAALLVGCATAKPPTIAYDDVPLREAPVVDARADNRASLLHQPPKLTVSRGGPKEAPEVAGAVERVATANEAARIEPKKTGYYNAIQVYSYSPGALYQVYAAPEHVTEIALEPGEKLIGPGPISAGDTVRWMIGDTVSGDGESERVHLLIKPTRPDLRTNLVVNTDRRSYHLELRSTEEDYLASVAWAYPDSARRRIRHQSPSRPAIPPVNQRLYRYALSGDRPPWTPLTVFDDRRKVYVVFPRGISRGEMPPILVIGEDGSPQLANFRVHENVMVVDRLFGAAELRLGSKKQQVVRIERTTPATTVANPVLARLIRGSGS